MPVLAWEGRQGVEAAFVCRGTTVPLSQTKNALLRAQVGDFKKVSPSMPLMLSPLDVTHCLSASAWSLMFHL